MGKSVTHHHGRIQPAAPRGTSAGFPPRAGMKTPRAGSGGRVVDEGLVLLLAWGQMLALLGLLGYFLLRGRS